MTWHVSEELLRSYHRATTDPTVESSVEAHIVSCATCQRSFSDIVAGGGGWLMVDEVWSRVVDAIDAPKRSLVERTATRLGLPEHTARLLLATPGLRLSWAASVLFAVTISLALASGGDGADTILRIVHLLIAPVLPAAGVALAFAPAADPAYEVGAAAPTRGLRLVLLRTAMVVAATVIGGIPVVIGGGWSWASVAWLVPAFAVASATLAISTVVPSVWTAAGLSVTAWVAFILVLQDPRSTGVEGAGAATQTVLLALVVAALAVVMVRGDAFARGASR